jgi:hypothetical protein
VIAVTTSGIYQPMFLPGVLASASLASAYLGGVTDVGFMSGALEMFSDAMDGATAPSIANSFYSAFVTFQRAVVAGDHSAALALAHGELASIVSGIPSKAWPGVQRGLESVARRTGVLSDPDTAVIQAREFLRSPVLSWRPSIIVDAGSPKARATVSAAFRKAAADMLAISASCQGGLRCDHAKRAFKSGLLDAPAVEVEVIPGRKDIWVGTRCYRSKEGIPQIKVTYTNEEALYDWPLSYVIMSSVHHTRNQWANVLPDEAGRGWRLYQSELGRYLGRITSVWDRKPPWLAAAMRVQSRLLAGQRHEELIQALRELSLKGRAIDEAEAEMERLRFSVSLLVMPDLPAAHAFRAHIEHWPGSSAKGIGAGDRRSRPVLHAAVAVPPDVSDAIGEKDVWMFLARAYALWVAYERPGEDLTVSLADQGRGMGQPIKRMMFSGDTRPANLTDSVPHTWSDEFFGILEFADRLAKESQGQDPSEDPAVNDAIRALDDEASAGIFKDSAKLSSVRILHNTASEGVVFEYPSRTSDEYRLNVRTDLDTLSARLTPMQMAEIILAARAASYTRRRELTSFAELVDVGRRLEQFSDSMALLKLLWAYQKLQGSRDREQGTLELLGGGADSVSSDIAAALARVEVADGDAVGRSIAERDAWLIECSDRVDLLHGKEWASRVVVSVLPGARLVHFNGMPKLRDDDSWERLVRAIALAPEGVTWVRVMGGWDSNHRELIFADGDDGWYSLNEAYREADPAKRRSYRDALDFVRGLQRRYQDAIGLPLIEPASSRAAFRKLQSRMLARFHPDKSAHREFIDIGGDDVQEFIGAFQVLEDFYKP